MENLKAVPATPAQLEAARRHAYYLKNLDRFKAAARAYYFANHTKRRAEQAVWVAAHRKEVKAYRKDYYAKNQDHLRAVARANYARRKLIAAGLELANVKKGRP